MRQMLFIACLTLALSNLVSSAALAAPEVLLCGNGSLDGGETCDDGNAVSLDGCDKDCLVEAGWTCPTVNSACVDIDECLGDLHDCEPVSESCVNTPGGYLCQCAPGHFLDASIGTCQPCPKGQYNPWVGATECLSCEPGFYGPLKGAVKCKECPPGKFTDWSGAELCQDCDVGSHATGTTNTACTLCQAGTQAPIPGLEECVACPAGYASDVEGTVTCPACLPGYFTSGTGQLVCQACPGGKFASLPASTQCTLCGLGKYADTEGSAICPSCPAGHYSDKPGTVTCTPCSQGEYVSSTGSTACKECPAGRYTDFEGASVCTACPAGYFAPFDGATYCLPCSEGQASGEGSPDCSWCLPGTYAPTAASPGCIECPVGQEAPDEASTACTLCKAGTYTADTATVHCSKCPAGNYQPAVGQTSCLLCSVGSHANLPGQSACLPCDPGSYAGTQGTSVCTSCEVGHFQSLSGQSHCFQCEPGTFADQTGLTSCLACDEGFYSQDGATACYSQCGDGIVVQEEECDDFNQADGDCCDSECKLNAADTLCGPEATSCAQQGACDGIGGCQVLPEQDGKVCDDDGDLCNGISKCQGGQCSLSVGPVSCEAPDACHQPGSCSAQSGLCSFLALPDNTFCDEAGQGTNRCFQGTCVTLGIGTTCVLPWNLQVDAPKQFTTADGFFTFDATPCLEGPLAGPQLFFQAQLQPGKYLVRLVPEPGFDAILVILGTCAPITCSASVDTGTAGQTEVYGDIVVLPDQSSLLRLMVGAATGQQAGSFTIEVARVADVNPDMDGNPEVLDDVQTQDVLEELVEDLGTADSFSPDMTLDSLLPDTSIAPTDLHPSDDGAATGDNTFEETDMNPISGDLNLGADITNAISIADAGCHVGHGGRSGHTHTELAAGMLLLGLLALLGVVRLVKRAGRRHQK